MYDHDDCGSIFLTFSFIYTLEDTSIAWMLATYDEDDFAPSTSRFGTRNGKPGSRVSSTTNGRRSSPPVRGTNLAQTLEDDVSSGRHSLAHELAFALMPEPTAGSKLLSEELGIEYDEGAEGIDHSELSTDTADVLEPSEDLYNASHSRKQSSPTSETAGDYDPAFDSPTTPQRRSKFPEQDPMVTLAQDLESTDRFISQLRRLDGDQSGQPNLERLASDMIRRIDDTVREREGQVRELLEYEREFRRIAGEIGGTDVLSRLDELEDIIESPRAVATPQDERSRALDAIQEESGASNTSLAASGDWEAELDQDRERLAEDEEDYDVYSPSPLKTSFTVPPLPTGPPTPAAAIVELTQFRTFTTSVASSLATISEQTQVNSAATTEAGRKIRALKNKLGGWKAEWESAERSREKVEKWEAGAMDVGEGIVVVVPVQNGQGRPPRAQLDGRKVVAEHQQAFEVALEKANMKINAIMAAVR